MSFGRNAYLGAEEVQQLIGKWQSIVGSGASDGFQDILGATTYYNPYPGGRRQPPAPHYNYGGYRQPPPCPPQYGGYWSRQRAPQVRNHRAQTAYRAIVHGDPTALGALELMGAEEAAEAVADAQDAVAEETGAPPQDQGYQIPPRNQLVDRPGPTRADRVLLPMSSGVSILPNTSAQITSRPQNVAFRPERVIIGGTAGDWIVNDIKVGNRSQFSQSGDVPGETFASTTIDSFVSFETVQTAMDFVMLVTYIGSSESGAPFYCAVLGTAAL